MEPLEGTIVIFDEIDHMLNNNSFYLKEVGHTVEACYLPSLLTRWVTIIGFSGTMGSATAQQLHHSFPHCKSIGVPSLRIFGNTNKLVFVQKVIPSALVPSVIARMKALHNQFCNFIVLCKDLATLELMKKALAQEANEHLVRERQVVVFD